ncbi:hypothetical protein EHQ12_02195 [Leptospira gomenensis]|uniref:Uncharacterized protein n=1 Tax=Leptospira gomenensis TaxID=2484974 RepID=A0A5F1Y8D4_9LEPT|nr:hypothetical protein [Leptospira gomenensis]TGK31533.1 hypothetical protein EHQ17_14090 [Leptospira gomenensis]TGK44183.1 hypothetical protein EHQ12_02195 [Leptospira gomenensis]TGK46238.1 hypothetical protein EHQ07_07325 [Leptospira gomenensis]TGK54763.1 hypothetical protein EHQ13_18915 [Leptospira gomenensis]
MIRPTAILFKYALVLVATGACTFGSVGNSEKEEAKTLQRLLTLYGQRPSSFSPNINYTDDQQDANISSFDVVSGTSTYRILLQTGSEIIWNGVSIRINPNPVPVVPGQSRTISNGEHSTQSHTPYTVPLDLPVTSPYAQEYGTPSFTDSGMETSNGTILTGDVHVSQAPSISGAPAGYLASVKYKIRSMDLRFRIERTVPAGVTRNVRIRTTDFVTELFPRCRIDVAPELQAAFPVNWLWNGIFPDQNGVSLLDTISALADPVEINPYQNTNLYVSILANISRQDRVVFPTGCTVF